MSMPEQSLIMAPGLPAMPLRLILIAATLLTVTAPSILHACNYGKYGLKPGSNSQATVDGLFRGTYTDRESWRASREWRTAAQNDRDLATDIPGKLNYAWSLLMSGEQNQAFAIYQQLLKDQPDNYEIFCSYATALHAARNYSAARDTLQKAIQLKPGFRNHAEELHLSMLEHEIKSRINPAHARNNLFIPELTPLWDNRKPPEENFSTVDFPARLSSKSIAELLRQYPRYGEGWLALGMLLEHEKDFSMAVKAYDRALQYGTAHKQEIERYLATFREFGRAHDPGRLVARGVARLGIGLAVIAVALFLYRILARVIWDISSHRAMKEDQKRRGRRKNDNGPLR